MAPCYLKVFQDSQQEMVKFVLPACSQLLPHPSTHPHSHLIGTPSSRGFLRKPQHLAGAPPSPQVSIVTLNYLVVSGVIP